MKKILFCAGILALMASCTQDEFEQQAMNSEAQAPGISFVAKFAQAPATKGEVFGNGNVLDYRWYAEQDRVNFYGKNVKKGFTDPGTVINFWSEYGKNTPVEPALYKATRSENDPYFTGINDGNILRWNSNTALNPAEFLGVYPITVTLALATDENKKWTDGETPTQFVFTDLPSLSSQTQTSGTDGNSIAERTLMVAYNTAYPEKSYESVGEKVEMKFDRPMGYLGWRTLNYDKDPELEKYGESLKEYLGSLKKVEVTAKGYDANGNNDYTDEGDIAPSVLNYGNDASLMITMPTKDNKDIDWKEAKFVTLNANTYEDADLSSVPDYNKMALTINGEWSDNYTGYMIISPVNREAYHEADKAEEMNVTYSFENIDLVVDKNSPRAMISLNGVSDPKGGFNIKDDWGFSNVYWPFSLDIAKYSYLVTKGANSSLIINTADFEEFYDEASNTIAWNGEQVDASTIKNIVSKKKLTDEELALLKDFTGVKKIVLTKNDVIPTHTFVSDVMSDLEEINLPLVTDIKENAFVNSVTENGDFEGLKVVKMQSYPFRNRDLARSFLDPATLEYLDMTAATLMNVGFPSQGFVLTNYSVLEEVEIGENLTVGPNAFDGCVALTTLDADNDGNNTVKISTNGFAAFRGTDLTSIELKETTEIPAYTFNGCEMLTTVTMDANPTVINEYAFNGCENLISSFSLASVETIGNYAFFGCGELTIADLKSTKTIGRQAFKNCAKLYGGEEDTPSGLRKVLYVGAETVGESAFHQATALEHIEFQNMTLVEKGLLGGCSNLVQIQFNKAFTCDVENTNVLDGVKWSTTFGSNPENITLFVDKANQKGCTSTTLTVGDTDNTKIVFRAILDVNAQ